MRRLLVTALAAAVVLAIPFSTLRAVNLDPSLDLPPGKRLAIEQLA